MALNSPIPLRLKHKDLEASFGLERAEQEAKLLPAPLDQAAEPTPEEKKRFDEIARLSPRAAIIELRATLDNAVRSLATAPSFQIRKPLIYQTLSASFERRKKSTRLRRPFWTTLGSLAMRPHMIMSGNSRSRMLSATGI
jgi:hypothetical protein